MKEEVVSQKEEGKETEVSVDQSEKPGFSQSIRRKEQR